MNVVSISMLLLVAAICSAEENPILSDEFINEINSKQTLWRAGRNFDPNTPMSQLRYLCGVNNDTKFNTENVMTVHHTINQDDIPDFFDAREYWDKCASIKVITDQSACGSCWAVSTSAAISDRICIASNGTSQPIVSTTHLLTCCEYCGSGCQGGFTISAWRYWELTGVVTGGAYNTTEGCQNYPFPPCDHHTFKSRSPCPDSLYETPTCSDSCDPGWTQSFEESLTFGKSHYFVEKIEEQIQTEILKNGPVVAIFTIYTDFLNYKSGIYKQTAGINIGRHAVRVLGWGVENNVKYWIIANSWNEDWGEKGIFRIIRGSNDCGIEEEISAGLAKV